MTSVKHSSKRHWLPYEKNQLLKYGFDLDDLDKYEQMPVEYITGKVEFMGYEFEVNSKVMIPRVETEEFVKLALEQWQQLVKQVSASSVVLRVIDVGTGSGAIGIMFLLLALADLQLQEVEQTQELEPVFELELFLSDISSSALQVAKQNFEKLVGSKNLPSFVKVKFVKSDLLAQLNHDLKFDLILANLPYIPQGRLSKLQESVINYEPNLALSGGEDGLVLIRKLLAQIFDDKRLKPQGKILVEVDEQVQIDCQSLDLPQKTPMQIIPDQFHNQRFIIIKN